MGEQQIQVFMEYKIVEKNKDTYEAWMAQLPRYLSGLGVENFQWFEAVDQPGLYVELFSVPSMETFEQIQSLRRTIDHPLFGQLAQWMHKPLEQVNCWAFHDRSKRIN